MRLIGWFCVLGSAVSAGLGILIARENRRAYSVLCGRGRVWACLQDSTGAAWAGLLIGIGLLAFGILILAIRRPRRPRRGRNAYDPDHEQMRLIRRI